LGLVGFVSCELNPLKVGLNPPKPVKPAEPTTNPPELASFLVDVVGLERWTHLTHFNRLIFFLSCFLNARSRRAQRRRLRFRPQFRDGAKNRLKAGLHTFCQRTTRRVQSTSVFAQSAGKFIAFYAASLHAGWKRMAYFGFLIKANNRFQLTGFDGRNAKTKAVL